jgi:ATP-dependent DNA helicase RecQ
MDYMITALEAVKQTNERFTLEHLVRVIRGEMDDYVISYKHDTLPVFGKGKEDSDKHWTSVIRQAMIAAMLEKDIENYGHLKITLKGNEFLEAPYSVDLYKDHDFEKLSETETQDVQVNSGLRRETV